MMKIMKIWKYLLSLAVVSFALTACLKGDGWEEENRPQPEPEPAPELSVTLSTPSVMGDNEDYVEITVLYEGEPVTIAEGLTFWTDDKSLLEVAQPAAYRTRAEEGPYDVTEYFEEDETGVIRLKIAYVGLFSFWAEFGEASAKSETQSVKAVPAGLYAELSKSSVVADGRDYAEVLVYHEGRQVTGGIKYFDMEDKPADDLFSGIRYRTTTPGEFTFYVSYQGLDTKESPLTVTAEEPDVIDVPEKGLYVYLSSTVIQANGKDAVTVKVFFDGAEVSDQATYYSWPDSDEIHFPNGTYTTTTAGSFSFWVNYGTANSYATPSTITAVNFAIPDRPADPNPSSTNFVRRVMVMQFTGTGCGYCPLMMTALRNLKANEAVADKFVIAACHSYNSSDPMYLGPGLSSAFGVSSYPSVVMDMRQLVSNSQESSVRNAIENNYNRIAPLCGIGVHSEVEGNTVVAHVTVKAAQEKAFYIGIMVLEDGIKATQANYNSGLPGDFNTHNNTIRLIDGNRNYKGYELGTIKAGSVVDQIFALNLDAKWVQANCRLAVYVCTDEGNGYYVNNIVATDGLTANLSYEYAE